ncbi:Adenine/guanine permease AZG1 [Tetrabaena socialis]|uniref:Adenine/guanine permease AZG1 n=1 Tax=Tetrabaena socialis TaxID=47790 RepID=A0A2J8AKH4_9CHLO|nr:Adenine/guanine permease AZG1 [Tetrabaena socialis]|eukprot:PNH13010.1 Adenine/guanine permease AZG1 [Tetrabaena socialis]
MTAKDLERSDSDDDKGLPPVTQPSNAFTRALEPVFNVHTRGSSWGQEIRAGCVLFMTSAYILFLNPIILSGATSGFNTGMPGDDIALATSVSTGCATFLMGLVANYPWVVSVQLGTNTYFVTQVLKLGKPCGHHAHFYGNDKCTGAPCSCSLDGTVVNEAVDPTSPCFGTKNNCLGTEIPYEMALAATFLEGLVFLAICFLGLRKWLIRLFPKSVLMAGAAGIGCFITFVGVKDMGLIVAAPFPTLLSLNLGVPYVHGGWGQPGHDSKVSFNSCRMYFDGPPYSVVCPWLSLGGLIFTAILLCYNISGAFIMGIFFTMFISWMKFPEKISTNLGLVPDRVAYRPKFIETAGAINFAWGNQTGELIEAFVTFLYLDFIGSCITFVAMGEMCGILDEKGNMPRSNIAFLADGFGTMLGGLLGTSALTTYVESAAAVREGGRTGITAIVCSLFFFASCFVSPLFSHIPSIATGPILALIGVLIFMPAILEINWNDLTEAIPAFVAILGMPFTHNIAYGIIGGLLMHVIIKFFTFKLFAFQRTWPGAGLYRRWGEINMQKALYMRVPGWNVDIPPSGRAEDPWYFDPSLETAIRRKCFPHLDDEWKPKVKLTMDKDAPISKPSADLPDDSAHRA